MDYIREELVRQQNLWAMLLLGRREAPEEKTRRQADGVYPAETAERGTFTAGTAARLGQIRGSGVRPEENRVPDVTGWSLRERRKQRAGGQEGFSGGAGGTRPAEWGRMAPVRRRDRGNVGGDGETWTVTELVRADDGGTFGARELSKVFQRDARRYDGGFTLY